MTEHTSANASSHVARKLLIFGPQALSFDTTTLCKLGPRLHAPNNLWLLDVLFQLHENWRELSRGLPGLSNVQAERHLLQLTEALQANVYDDLLYPLPHILLAPLVVITHLVQYTTQLRVGCQDLLDEDPVFAAATENAQILGLCTGTLSASAVACASSYKQLKQYGAAAIRIAMAVGASVDAYDHENGLSCSLSTAWNDPIQEVALQSLVEEFPDTYVSVRVDKRRLTITSGQQITDALRHRLEEAGLHVTDLKLSGRFHWWRHQELAHSLVRFCNESSQFQLPDAAETLMPIRSESTGERLTTGSLHSLAIKSILLDTSDWSTTYGSADLIPNYPSELKITCFGLEHCVPPTVARRLGSSLEYACDIEANTLSGSISSACSQSPLKSSSTPDQRVAVVGMSCHAPGAKNLDEFWNIIMSGESQHTVVPDQRFGMATPWRPLDPSQKWYGNFIQDHDTFDHKFFKKNPREAASTDPQQRLALKIAYQAVEQSGSLSRDQNDKHVACYVGVGNNDYERNIACHSANAYSAKGNLRGFIAGNISHYFGWTGPSMTFDSACSSSTAAIHYACQSISSGDCTAALAGGVNLFTNPDWFHNLAGASFLSPSGQCKPFDAAGDGYCRGEGGGFVYLKSLSRAQADGDQIFGVISGTQIYQNQNSTAITVPNAPSLSALFKDVLQKAKLKPDDVSVVEAHGTGTPVGDPAEYAGIRSALGATERSQTLHLTSVKGSIGHCEFASGVLSLLKVLLMLYHDIIPPQASFSQISAKLQAAPGDKICIPQICIPWTNSFRAALINNYGASGSNASMVVTQYSRSHSLQTRFSHAVELSTPIRLYGLDDRSLIAYCAKLSQFLQEQSPGHCDLSIHNLSFQLCRQSNCTLPRSLILSARSRDDLHQQLTSLQQMKDGARSIQQPPARPIILCFGGQISTFVGLDPVIYQRISIFRLHLDDCNTACLSLGLEGIFPAIFKRSTIDDVVELQCALFAMQYSCAKSWIDCGVQVAAIVGHSFGELVGLCVGGAYSLKDGLRLISGRAIIVRDFWEKDNGAMLAVEGHQAIDLISSLAATNATFSSLKLKRLNVTNAFHTALVDSLEQRLLRVGKDIAFDDPKIRVYRATEQCEQRLNSRFVFEHMRTPVFFNAAIQRLAQDFPSPIWLEAGSKSTVTVMASRALVDVDSSYFQAMNLTDDGAYDRLAVDYTPLILPPYQFEDNRHWMPLKDQSIVSTSYEQPLENVPSSLTTFLGYQDTEKSSVRFRVNTSQKKFQELTAATLVVETATMPSTMLQLEVVLDAFSHLRSDFKSIPAEPEFRNVEHHRTFLVDEGQAIYLDAVKRSDSDSEWQWKFSSQGSTNESMGYTSGILAFRLGNPSRTKEELESLERLVDLERCSRLLIDTNADEVLQGLSIYRAFEPVVAWGAPYQNVPRMCAKGSQAAGLVKRAFDSKYPMDSVLSECFCQVSSFHINLMGGTADSIFICTKIGRWYRAPLTSEASPQTDLWKVFATHKKVSGAFIVSDVFAFDSRTETLQEIILGISYQQISKEALCKTLVRVAGTAVSGPISSAPLFAEHTRQHDSHPSASSLVSTEEHHEVSTQPSVPSPLRPRTESKARQILCNLAGLESDDVQDDSDLIEIGVDSLMAMELAHEVKVAFKCVLSTEQLMELTDFRSLVTCINYELGFDNKHEKIGHDQPPLPGQEAALASLSQCSPYERSVDAESGLSQLSDGNISPHSGTFEDFVDVQSDIDSGDRDATQAKECFEMPAHRVTDTFEAYKWRTDEFITAGGLAGYRNKVLPRSTELCIVYIIQAFERLGCSLQSAHPGQRLQRISHQPKHRKFVDLLYGLLEHEARLIDIDADQMVRTNVSVPSKSDHVLLGELLRDEPLYSAEHKLIALIGANLADCLCGKQEGIQILFSQGRDTLSDMYANSPFTGIWIAQLEQVLKQLLGTPDPQKQPLYILEVGAGAGGSTSKLAAMIASLGVPVKYTFTDVSGSLVAAGRKKFKSYAFMDFQVLNIEAEPPESLLSSQQIILSTNCIHATRDLSVSLGNIRKMLRPDGVLALLEMTRPLPWVDLVFGLTDGWWLFQDDRQYVLTTEQHWERVLYSIEYGHVDWTEGELPEADIQRLILAHASGPRHSRASKPQASITNLPSPHSGSLERRAVLDTYIHKYTEGWTVESKHCTTSSKDSITDKCVLVTGATGSLGSHVVADLAHRADVGLVICLNRVSNMEATTRQHESFTARGISMSTTAMDKLKVIATDTSKSRLGLSQDVYEFLVQKVTHLVHSAWPMSLTRQLRGYELQFKVFRNLIDLATDAANYRPPSMRIGFQFISSIAVVGVYPNWAGHALVPEKPTVIETVPRGGYAEAKVSCETMLSRTLYQHPERFSAMAVRIAQISGSATSGCWNPTEYIPILSKSSQVLRTLPDLEGTFAWCPVDQVAGSLSELLMSETTKDLIYHIDNPSRQSWKHLIALLSRLLNIPTRNIVPHARWIERVRRFRASVTDNPALQLIEFFDSHFIPMSCGGLVLDVTETSKHSETLRNMQAVSDDLLTRYVDNWKQSGYLNP
ncbi:hypothetical protein E4T48_07381 [Aureobasidium sp. EXF-10727]|nr:hypothetical protein E4T48_07381 [Aureobasidium sp. EXF-10727]